MVATVTFDAAIGGDDSTVTDDADATTGLAGGGHRTRFVPALSQFVAVAAWIKSYMDTKSAAALASAGAANTSAGAANTAKLAAEAALASTLTAYDNFDDRYLGTKAADPATDNDGAALLGGTLYYNTTIPAMRLYTGSAWVNAYVSGGQYVDRNGDQMTGALDLAALANVASAGTCNIGAATTNNVTVTGAVGITGWGVKAAGAIRHVTFSGAPLLTHHATSMILPGAANIQAAAGDTGTFLSLGGGNWRCLQYQRASGLPVVSVSVPAGGIIMWSGSIGSIPAGWALCDGTGGTPDLRNKFIVGAGSTYAVNATGGAVSNTPTITVGATTLSTSEMPAHTHPLGSAGPPYTSPTGYGSNGFMGGGISTDSTGGGGSHGHSATSASVPTLPPYLALAYIMKL